MAEIPLLTREQEISLAKKIEVTRKRFRRSVLGCNYTMQATIETLEKVHTGVLPFDRTIKVSLTERLTKEQILARMPHNWHVMRAVGKTARIFALQSGRARRWLRAQRFAAAASNADAGRGAELGPTGASLMGSWGSRSGWTSGRLPRLLEYLTRERATCGAAAT
jgi:hypothetical protein